MAPSAQATSPFIKSSLAKCLRLAINLLLFKRNNTNGKLGAD